MSSTTWAPEDTGEGLLPPGFVTYLWISGGIVVAITLVLSLASPVVAGWYVLPLIACSTGMGAGVIRWLVSGDFMDVRGWMCLFGTWFFGLAAIFQLYVDKWHPYLPAARNLPLWIGAMGLLNLIGLVVYWGVQQLPRRSRIRRPWRLDRRRFLVVSAAAMLLSAAVQGYLIVRQGGIGGYLAAYDVTVQGAANNSTGLGSLQMFGHCFPTLFIMTAVITLRDRKFFRSWTGILLLLVTTGLLAIVFGGLRGSRGHTVNHCFWALGLVHLYLRRIPVSTVLFVFTPLAMAFCIVYGVYKWGGTEGLRSIMLGRTTQRATIRGWEHTAFFDLARTEIQATLLQRMTQPPAQYAWGRTYAAAMAKLIPRGVWPNRPPDKHKETTNALFGRGRWSPDNEASYSVGLAGEALLNFGPLSVPLAFAVFGWLVRATVQLRRNFDVQDGRGLFLPFLILFCEQFLMADSNNVWQGAVGATLLPLSVVILSSRRPSMESLAGPARPRNESSVTIPVTETVS